MQYVVGLSCGVCMCVRAHGFYFLDPNISKTLGDRDLVAIDNQIGKGLWGIDWSRDR